MQPHSFAPSKYEFIYVFMCYKGLMVSFGSQKHAFLFPIQYTQVKVMLLMISSGMLSFPSLIFEQVFWVLVIGLLNALEDQVLTHQSSLPPIASRGCLLHIQTPQLFKSRLFLGVLSFSLISKIVLKQDSGQFVLSPGRAVSGNFDALVRYSIDSPEDLIFSL